MEKTYFYMINNEKNYYIYVPGGSAVTYKKYYYFNYSLRNDTLLLFKSDKFLPPLVDFLKSRYKIPSLEIGRLVCEENLINIKAKKVEGRIKIANNVVVSEFVDFDNLEVGRDYFVNNDTTLGSFCAELLVNPASLMKIRYTVRDFSEIPRYNYHYYPCDLFYEMNGKKNE